MNGPDAADRLSPRRRAMDCLARREHSVAELRAKLAARDYESQEIDSALDALVREGLASDERFADAFTSAARRKGQGPVRIRAELERRGIDTELIDACVDASGGDWLELARAVREKKFGAELPADFRERARQMRFLQYRGFTSEQIRVAVASDLD